MNLSNVKSSGNVVVVVAAMVFSLAGLAVPAQAQTPTVVYTFTASGTPQNPYAWAIAQGREGDLYSTTCATDGGTSVVFNVTPTGTLSTVDNTTPACSYGVTLGTDGNFYGAASSGGTDNVGEVYKVTSGGVATVLHSFTAGSDGSVPIAPPIEGTNGVFYGTTTSIGVSNSTAYSVTSAGVFTTLHTFTGTDGQNVYATLVQGTDGNFYGTSAAGGTSNDGVIFKMTPTGTVSVLHNFAGTDGSAAYWGLIQAADGNFYGTTTTGGTDGAGVIYKITSSGTYTVLFNFSGSATGNLPRSSLVQATNGTFYGVTSYLAGPFNFGTIYSFTTGGVFTTLYSFPNQSTNGDQPSSPLRQHTNGLLYGTSYSGGDLSCLSVENDGELVEVVGCGTVYSLDIGTKPFVSLETTSGKVGAKVGILGQGFSSSSVVKFGGGVTASFTRSGTTYISATVPAGATDGKVTVTTGSTTLTSTSSFTVHDSWSSGAAMPTGTVQSAAAVLGGEIYVIGGYNTSGTVLTDVQIYNPTTNKWSTGTPLPTATGASSAAVVNNILYVFGGSTATAVTGAVWAYSPKTKAWTSMAPMLTARNGTLAVVEKNSVYVMGGNLGGGANFVATVESYNPATNMWTEETPMDGAKDYAGGGLIGTTIVAADGAVASGQITGDTEGYNATTNEWSELTADPTARTGVCSGVIGSALYDVSGYVNNTGAATTVNESFSSSANKWTTTLAPIPQGSMYPTPAVDNGQLYCFGGWATLNGTAVTNVQIYQP